MAKTLLMLLIVLALPGCGDPPRDAETATELRDAVQAPLDRVREVEEVTAGRKAGLDDSLDAAE